MITTAKIRQRSTIPARNHYRRWDIVDKVKATIYSPSTTLARSLGRTYYATGAAHYSVKHK